MNKNLLEMNADYFIEFFSAIPDEDWQVGPRIGEYKAGCALNHAAKLPNGVCELVELFARASLLVSQINDFGIGGMFIQATPKARILAALEYLKNVKNL